MRSGDRPGLQNRRAAGFPVAGGFDPHSLPPFVWASTRVFMPAHNSTKISFETPVRPYRLEATSKRKSHPENGVAIPLRLTWNSLLLKRHEHLNDTLAFTQWPQRLPDYRAQHTVAVRTLHRMARR
jgi:hypothetical protein